MSKAVEIALTISIALIVIAFWATVVVETPVMVFAAVLITLLGSALIWSMWIDS